MNNTILYVEEFENTFINALIKRADISLVLIRFSHYSFFTADHLLATRNIPTFIIDKTKPIIDEANRLNEFLMENNIVINYFFNDSEFNQEYIQQVARILSLPGALSEKQAKTVRDKVVMKDFIRKIGYNCPDYRPVHQIEDVLNCVKEWGYPIIIKWRTGVSSIKVYRVEQYSQLIKLDLDYSSGEYMVEQFCPYKIWCIDAIVSEGIVRNNFYTWLPYTNLDFAEGKKKFAQIAVGEKPQNWKFNPYIMTQHIVSNLGVRNGYLHLEAFITDEADPIICEFAWRTPGDHMLSNFTHLYGIDIPSQLIDALIEEEISTVESSSCCVADVFLPMKEGTIIKISSIEQLKKQCSILDGEVFYHAGDTLNSEHRYTDSTGWVQVSAESIDDILAKIDDVYAKFRLYVKDVDI